MDEKMIIDKLWLRAEDVLTVVAEKYGKLCTSIAMSVTGSAEDAGECVNDVYMKLWSTVPPERPSSLKAYLAKLTRNAAIDKVRASVRQKRSGGGRDVALSELESCIPGGETPEDAFEERELAERINAFLRERDKTSRLIFIGRYWSYMSVADLAEKFGFSQSKVKSILHRTRCALKEKLEKEGYSI